METRFKRMAAVIISSVITLTGCGIDKGNGEISSYLTPNAISPAAVRMHVASLSKSYAIPEAIAKFWTTEQAEFDFIEDDETETIYIEDDEAENFYIEEKQKITDVETEVSTLPKNILDEISYQKRKYPGMSVAVGIYSLDGTQGYEYNAEAVISGGCTIKAPYAMYVLQECEKQGIDITTETLTYKKGMRNGGSGTIKNSSYGTEYTIEYLLDKLLGISDNTAYNILVSKFPLKQYQEFLNEFGGQNLYGRQYGSASVIQRKNEWLTIYEYVNSDAKYAKTLREDMTNTKYCYIADWMKGEHSYMHKSGWSNGKSYTCACDCAIIDENYLLIVFTQDYKTCVAHTDTVKSIGVRVEEFANSLGGKIF